MKKPILSGLLTALLLAACAGQGAPDATVTPTPSPAPGALPQPSPQPAPVLKWSDPATWPGGEVPAEGAAVTIPTGKRVLLDVSPPPLASVTIPAGSTLAFDDRPLDLRADWIMIHGGRLEAGTEAAPLTADVSITLTDRTPGEDVHGMGDKVIAVMDGGTLDLHGRPRLSWTRLARTARAGTDELVLDRAPDWRAGDVLVVASSDFDQGRAEQVVVRSVAGSTVTLAQALKWSHHGELQTFAGRTLDERAEVGLLSRNVVVRGETASSASGFGGHVMVMTGSTARVEGAELTRMGQKGVTRRYPIHFHMLGDAPGSYVRGSSLHGLFNRCVTVHGTNRVTLDGNVAYGTIGHCFFLEDGAETGNQITNNLALGTRRPDKNAGETAILPTDTEPATFWITNPANTVRGNVAAGSDGTGFWYALPEHPTGLSAANGGSVWPRRTPLGEFSGNVAHSNGSTGLNVDGGPNASTLAAETTWYRPSKDPADPKSEVVRANFADLTAYKNRFRGVWLRGEGHDLTNAVLADNAIGATFASNDSHLVNALVVGESANRGGEGPSWETRRADGGSLPLWWEPSFPIRGFEFYDGRVSARGSTFVNFTPDAQRPASALGYLRRNAFPLSPLNAADTLTFVNANRVYLEDPAAGYDGDRAAVFRDADGSVTGTAGRVVAANSALLFDASCARRDDWNAYVCQKDYGRLWLDDVSASGAGALTVTRARDAVNVTLAGVPDGRTYVSTSVPLGEKYTLAYAGSAPARLRIGLNDRRPGDTLRLSLPYSTEPALYRDWWVDERNRLTKVALADLEGSTAGNVYAYEGGVLHVKLVVKAGLDWAELEVCRTTLCR
ncbi:G8 domain-containing protein [Deinococcus pimensis]|uniref:G8 domain-containing protein n=1 Tax=Deinococcus pimensis TaxID=309888 RepID=UPI000485B3CF|nr:G8 domain-containing protein [Deinococcus pimensis]